MPTDQSGRAPAPPVDPAGPFDAASTFVRIAASLEPVDTVLWFRGTVHQMVPGSAHRHLFDIEGYRITRAAATADGWDLRSRVAAFHLRPGTEDLLTHLPDAHPSGRLDHLPGAGVAPEVMHVWNDPVTTRVPRQAAPARPQVIGEQVHLAIDGFFVHPNPLTPQRWPRESSGDLLEGADLCRLMAPLHDVRTSIPSVPCALSIVRLSPWLPWMARGTRPGQLVYHLGGMKLPGWASLPIHIRRRVEAERPEFAFAPTSDNGPDESTWTRVAASRRPSPRR